MRSDSDQCVFSHYWRAGSDAYPRAILILSVRRCSDVGMAHYDPGKRSPHRVMRRSLTRVVHVGCMSSANVSEAV